MDPMVSNLAITIITFPMCEASNNIRKGKNMNKTDQDPISQSSDRNPTKADYLKFAILSAIGVLIYFVPIKGPATPIVLAINWVKGLFGDSLPYLVISLIFVLNITLVLGKVFKIKIFEAYHNDDKPFQTVFFITSLIIIILILMNVDLAPIRHEKVGGHVLTIASNVVITIFVAGSCTIFILKSGIVEFFGGLLEPLMRPVFQLPGEASVNAVASFVSAASVGVYFTDVYYKQKIYTDREAVNTSLHYSVVSLGFMALLCTLNGVEEYYGSLILWSFILTLVIAAICARIPPVTWKANRYVDGRVQTEEDRRVKKIPYGERVKLVVRAAAMTSREFTVRELLNSTVNAMKFAQKIIAVNVTVVLIALSLVYFTPIFEIIGKPMIPVLELLQIPEAATVAPSTLIGFIEITLPSILVSSANLPQISGFYIALLSCCQIIFMTEAGNAMLSSSMPISFKDLVVAFIERTIISIPLCALVVHLIF